jgi:beta-galactosidase
MTDTLAPVPSGAGPAAATRAKQAEHDCPSGTFTIGEQDFLLDGRPFRILSGALHYFRVHPDLWADRICKARQMGLNTIETYVAWNAHAPNETDFTLAGGLDLGRFLDEVAEQGMQAIVRPGPYICAEWDNGGLPAWLLRTGDVGIRRDAPVFMAAVRHYYQRLAPVIVPRQVDKGGPIILVQVENEYGAYGRDERYLRKLVILTRAIGITVPLFTVDQPVEDMLANGGLPDVLRTASFGSRASERLQVLRRHQPTGPLMCSEFWNGWFDDWGSPHHTTSAEQAADELDALLRAGASVNIYMFHGGTNFGFTNGANDKGTYEPITTSYDYDAPLDEAGNPTAKYWALRDVIGKFAPLGDETPEPTAPAPCFDAPVKEALSLWDVVEQLGEWHSRVTPPTCDELDHDSGFTLYRSRLDLAGPATLEVGEIRDRAQVFLDRDLIGVLSRAAHDTVLHLPQDAIGVLELLIEDQGRVDYGPRLGEPKGLIGPVFVQGASHGPWEAMPIDLSDLTSVRDKLRAARAGARTDLGAPLFARAWFDLPHPVDLFLDTGAWGKGVAWVNGFCLGRYWARGPQRTLYVPAPVLRDTGNELIVLELENAEIAEASFVAEADLGVGHR